jgi:hypothetical protein
MTSYSEGDPVTKNAYTSTHREVSFFLIFMLLSLCLVFEAMAEAMPIIDTAQEEIAYDLEGMISTVPWKIAKTEWGASDEEGYSRYISQIGEGISKGLCATMSSCFKNPQVNPYAASDPTGLRHYADCADFPYFLRAYYAWRNQLPFGFVNGISPIQADGQVINDVRYSPFGNTVRSRFQIVVRKGSIGAHYPNAIEIFNRTLPGTISSGTFRVSYSGMDADKLFSDFYPVKITRDGVRPGTTIYDPNGHVVTVYKVTRDGRVYYIDAHPDLSLTAGLYNSRFMRSYPGQGAGFKNWRPLKLSGAEWNVRYGFIGGRITGAKDRDLPMYSTEQYYGTNANPNWRDAEYAFQGKPLAYFDWVRNRLADGPLVVNPVDDVKIMAQELCNGIQERSVAVQVAVTAGVHQKEHPFRLPNNIYGAAGEWETYATPARDARLKVAFKEIRTYVEEALAHYRSHDGKVDYRGANLAADMLAAYNQASNACRIKYTNSDGQPVVFNLDQARARIYDISFDPYHCPELRWGGQGSELNSCHDDHTKRTWYEREKWLRFQHERNTDAYTGFTLDELTGPMPGAGVASGQDLDVIAFLKNNQ